MTVVGCDVELEGVLKRQVPVFSTELPLREERNRSRSFIKRNSLNEVLTRISNSKRVLLIIPNLHDHASFPRPGSALQLEAHRIGDCAGEGDVVANGVSVHICGSSQIGVVRPCAAVGQTDEGDETGQSEEAGVDSVASVFFELVEHVFVGFVVLSEGREGDGVDVFLSLVFVVRLKMQDAELFFSAVVRVPVRVQLAIFECWGHTWVGRDNLPVPGVLFVDLCLSTVGGSRETEDSVPWASAREGTAFSDCDPCIWRSEHIDEC